MTSIIKVQTFQRTGHMTNTFTEGIYELELATRGFDRR